MSSRKEENLNASIQNLQNKVDTLEKTVQGSEKDQNYIKTNFENLDAKSLAFATRLDEINQQVLLLHGALDEKKTKMNGPAANATPTNGFKEWDVGNNTEKNFQDLEKRISSMEVRLAVLSPERKTKSKDAIKFKTVDDLNTALSSLFNNKDYKKLIQTASNVLVDAAAQDQANVKDYQEMLKLALLYRGEAHFAAQEFDKAALDFTDLLDRYPKIERAPRALLLAGDSFIYLNKRKAAKAFYMQCVLEYPDKDECKAAKQRLDKLGNK